MLPNMSVTTLRASILVTCDAGVTLLPRKICFLMGHFCKVQDIVLLVRDFGEL